MQAPIVNNNSKMEPTLKLEMYAPQQPQQKPVGIYEQYMPLLNLAGNKTFSRTAFESLFDPTSAVSYGPNVKIPMQSVYNITLPGPTGGHVEMNKIYENLLPGKEFKMTSTTIGERLQTYEIVRQMLIKINDGEDIGLDENNDHSLLSYIKFMELNPNYYSPINSNPYKGLPYGLLIYRSCFPIRLDETNNSVMCAKNSIGLNIRLYALTYAEYWAYKFQQLIYIEYDVWRELAYYEYVRENILKKKQSPNFAMLYAFFMSPNKKINFLELKNNCMTQKAQITKEYQRFVDIHKLFSKVKSPNDIIRPMYLPDAARNVIAKLPDEINPEFQAYSGTVLILVTEAPHHNLYQWASREYETRGVRRTMISHGFYNEKIWYGVIFQIIAALYTMQVHGIYIREMTIQDNIYIKDLQTHGKTLGYWKYIIDGITYYLPNNGYVVLIDTNYKDIIKRNQIIGCSKREYKIYTSDIFGKKYSKDNIRQKIYENYKNIINTNSFTKEYTLNNVSKPPESIIKMIDKMMSDDETNDLSNVLSKYFRKIMHNRIGTLLRKDTEIPHIRQSNERFKKGEMAIEVIDAEKYRWCMILKNNGNAMVDIITKEDQKSEDYITKTVRSDSLKQYSSTEIVDQNTTPNINFSEETLLETYIISDN